MTRQQTIYETGARLTHDLKNMLQSLFALTSIAQHEPAQAQPILQNQLPVLTQRIEGLLVKLKAPGANDDMVELPAATWWLNLRQRHQHRDIEWTSEGVGEMPIPSALFDCVADNLIENASNKRLREPGIRISVSFGTAPLSLRVDDTGSAVPSSLAQRLLHTVVPSEDGLGVGLYQSARWAQQTGYRLILRENLPGHVVFELSRD
jgi:K+-sensing histidine kinase KdpD